MSDNNFVGYITNTGVEFNASMSSDGKIGPVGPQGEKGDKGDKGDQRNTGYSRSSRNTRTRWSRWTYTNKRHRLFYRTRYS